MDVGGGPVAEENNRTSAVKDLEDKVRFELLPMPGLYEVARAMHQGKGDREDHDWIKGQNWGYYLGAIFRHVMAWALGENYDKKTGCHHLAHAACSCMILITWQMQGKGKDDRQKYDQGPSHTL